MGSIQPAHAHQRDERRNGQRHEAKIEHCGNRRIVRLRIQKIPERKQPCIADQSGDFRQIVAAHIADAVVGRRARNARLPADDAHRGVIEQQSGQQYPQCEEARADQPAQILLLRRAPAQHDEAQQHGDLEVALVQRQRRAQQRRREQGIPPAAGPRCRRRNGQQQREHVDITPRDIRRVGEGERGVARQQRAEHGDGALRAQVQHMHDQADRRAQKQAGEQANQVRRDDVPTQLPVDRLHPASQRDLPVAVRALHDLHGVVGEAQRHIAVGVRRQHRQQGAEHRPFGALPPADVPVHHNSSFPIPMLLRKAPHTPADMRRSCINTPWRSRSPCARACRSTRRSRRWASGQTACSGSWRRSGS